MTPEDKRNAIAELDGWKEVKDTPYEGLVGKHEWTSEFHVPNYLTSYDAILPVIQRQSREVRGRIFEAFEIDGGGWTDWALAMQDATPRQLAEALLKATERRIE